MQAPPRITVSQQALLAVEMKSKRQAKPVLPHVSVLRRRNPRRNTRTPCCASRDQNCIRSMRSRNTWNNLPYEAETRSSWRCEARRGSPQIQVHAARVLAIRCSNKHSVTPWNREAVFRNAGVVQDLLRKWCHQFRTVVWPRRIMTTSLSQHHCNEARLS